MAIHVERLERIEPIPTRESEKEAKLIRVVMCVAVEQEEEFNETLHKYNFWKVIRTTSWDFRFITNCKKKTTNYQVPWTQLKSRKPSCFG